jgi:O-antigen ligase
VVVGAVTASVFITPVRERIFHSYDHFTISGGRSTIWRIGAELASEYPLGIGYHNSGILRQFAPEIPPELKHFHNNILNITAESGWLAGLIFLWFILSTCRFCLRQKTSPILVAFGCAVLSWQVAGLVEYNFGDSEITLLIWIALGLALQMTTNESTASASNIG